MTEKGTAEAVPGISIFKNIPDGLVLAQHHNGVAGLEDGIGLRLKSLAVGGFYQHHHQLISGTQLGVGQRRIFQLGRNGVQIYMGHHILTVFLHQQHLVGVVAEHEAVGKPLDQMVEPGAHELGPAQQQKNGDHRYNGGQGHQHGADLGLAQVDEHVEGCGEYGHGKGVAEKHGAQGQTAAELGTDDGLAFLGGKAGVGQQGYDLEPGFLLGHSREPEEYRNDIRDDNIEDDQKDKHNQRADHKNTTKL